MEVTLRMEKLLLYWFPFLLHGLFVFGQRNQWNMDQRHPEYNVPVSEQKINATISLIKETLSDGYRLWPVKQHNSKVYLNKFLRNYWIGDRYYGVSYEAQSKSLFKCVYPLSPKQSADLLYETDGNSINEIVYQCRNYEETCCDLDCCDTAHAMQPQPGFGVGQRIRSAAAAGRRPNRCIAPVVLPLALVAAALVRLSG